jgi:hypothetical protein
MPATRLSRRAVLVCAACLAPAAPRAQARPFSFAAHGAFRNLVQRRDYETKVTFAELATAGTTEAVGALSGLRGEITLIEGRRVVSLGPCPGCGPAPDSACLLASARVARWREEPVAEAVPEAALRPFLAARARAAGLDTAQPFPFRLRGELTDVHMHVHGQPNPAFAGHGSAEPMAFGDIWRGVRLVGEVVGFHASPDMVGIISHAGDPLHCHWVSPARDATAHLDEFGVAAGSTLLLPAA